MPKIDVNGIGIAYEIHGDGPKTAAITPGGRFSKDTPGVRELAKELAANGFKALIWDRPNCGESDMCFEGESESILNADTYAGLLKKLNLAPALLVGGSAGSRVTLLTATRHPDVVAGLFLLWISGGPIGLAQLAVHYNGANGHTANVAGMEGVLALPEWEESLRRNPGNRDIILKQDPKKFVATMQRWAESFFPKSAAPVPGLTPEQLAHLSKTPTIVLRSGASDLSHPRETSEVLASMIPGCSLQEPPWDDNEWNERSMRDPQNGLFRSWPKLTPQILELSKQVWK